MVDLIKQPRFNKGGEEGAQLFGRYRAVVKSNVDKRQMGRVKVFIPDCMLDFEKDNTWACPANNAVGGRNSDDENDQFYGESNVPIIGTWVWIFFENGNINTNIYMTL